MAQVGVQTVLPKLQVVAGPPRHGTKATKAGGSRGGAKPRTISSSFCLGLCLCLQDVTGHVAGTEGPKLWVPYGEPTVSYIFEMTPTVCITLQKSLK